MQGGLNLGITHPTSFPAREVAMTDDNDSTPITWRMQHAADRVVRQFSAAIAGTVDTLEVRHRRRVLERQLNALDDRAIADIGIEREQIPAIASAYPGAPQLLRRMMERLGVAPAPLLSDGNLRREMEWNCAACANRSPCRRWLKAAKPADGYRSFCANAAALDRLLSAQAA
jgi:uncharacterized protein YjiS (DUF1127 family)